MGDTVDTTHVDLVRNNFDEMQRERVATVWASGAGVAVERHSKHNYAPVVFAAIDRMATAISTDDKLRLLVQSLDNAYLFATDPHDNAECEFAHGEPVPIEVAPVVGEFLL